MTDPHSESSAVQRRPNAVEVEAELQRVLSSRCFEQAGRAKDFLRFVVSETIAGRGDRLKGYTVGVQVFGRPTDFDAQTDPLVRVEARRLRSRLLEYYATEGRDDPIRIEMPRGGYAPQFEWAAERAASAMPGSLLERPVVAPSRARPLVARRLAFAAPIALVALALWLLPGEWRERMIGRVSRDAAPASASSAVPTSLRRPTVLLPTFANLSGESDFDYFSYGITEDVATDLDALGVLVIRGATQNEPKTGSGEPPRADAEYLLVGTVRPAPDRIRVSARIVVAATGAQLWAEAFDEPADIKTLLSIQERIARRVSSTIAQPFGPIFQQEALNAVRKPAEYLDTYDCVLKYRYYRRNIDVRGHAESLDCFRRAVMREPSYPDAWAGLALIYLDEYLYGYDPQRDDTDPVSRALEAARKALDLDGDNALANVAMARIRYALGDLNGFERAAARVEALSPNTPDDLMTVGVLFGNSGNWDRGLPLIDKANALAGPGNAKMISVGYAIHELQTGNYDEALRYALRLDMPHWYVATTITIVAASLAERPDIARRATEQLLKEQPNIGPTIRTQLAKWHMNDDLHEKFIRGLNDAGIATP